MVGATGKNWRKHSSSPPSGLSHADLGKLGAGAAFSASVLAMFLTSGGDERIALDPLTGVNRYGAPPSPAPDEIWLSSSTAAAVSPRGYRAAQDALAAMMTGVIRPDQWFETLRARIQALYGVGRSQVVLCASGTEAELLALAVARHCLEGRLVNFVVAPDETGTGVMKAASGAHFLSSTALGGAARAGASIEGLDTASIETRSADLRNANGRPRRIEALDDEVRAQARAALGGGAGLMLHILDASKTGLAGPSRQCVLQLEQEFGAAKLLGVVDACQLRCSPAQIRADLLAGRMVMISGSKFAGGPPFSGALLIPEKIADRLQSEFLPQGLGAYSAQRDWPASLRERAGSALAFGANLGLGLRWEAALAELELYQSLDQNLACAVKSLFEQETRARIAEIPGLEALEKEPAALYGSNTILPVFTRGADASLAACKGLHEALRRKGDRPELARICHIGQPVAVGARYALRIALSAPHIVDIALRIQDGATIESAFAPFADDLDFLLRKWDCLARAVDEDDFRRSSSTFDPAGGRAKG